MTASNESRPPLAARLNQAITEYKARMGQPRLSIRALALAMQREDCPVTQQTLSNVLNGHQRTLRPKLARELEKFLGAPFGHLREEDDDEEEVIVMGRFAELTPENQRAVKALIADLRTEQEAAARRREEEEAN
jgi:hypothetical protein